MRVQGEGSGSVVWGRSLRLVILGLRVYRFRATQPQPTAAVAKV